MHKNIHFRFNWCVVSHLCSTQINSKSSKSRKFVCYEPLLKFPEHQFLCSVSVRGPRASRAPSMLGSFAGLHAAIPASPGILTTHLSSSLIMVTHSVRLDSRSLQLRNSWATSFP